MKKISLFCFAIISWQWINAQTFSKNLSGQALSFKELQRQFHTFKRENDLKQVKHWKNFKRLEMDMQLHTNGQGEPGDATDYLNESIRMSEYKSQNSSASAPWFPVGPNLLPGNQTGYMENGIGRVNCMAFDPSNVNTFYVGVAQGGLWKTTNGGQSYTPLTDNLPITRISDICLHPAGTNTMYISVCDYAYIGGGLHLNGRKRHTHYGLGVYKTTDGGTTWNPTGLTFQLSSGDASLIRKVVINPANTNEMLACGVSGMYKSTNAGSTWVKQMDSLFWDMIQDPANPSVIYAASGWVKNANDGYAGIYKSSNFGASWTMLNTGIPMQGTVQRIKLAIAPSDNNYVYALACDDISGFYGIYKSTNAGTNWTYYSPTLNILEAGQGNGTGGQGTYDLALLVDQTDKNKIYTGGVNIWGSADGGITFDPVSHWTTSYGATLHGDIHGIARQPVSGKIFAWSDGGVYSTTNLQTGSFSSPPWPTNWTKLNDNMQITSFYRLSSSKNNLGRLVAGAQDNATIYYDGSTWNTIFGGDGMDNYLSPLNHQEVVGSSQYGNFYYSSNNGFSGTNSGSNPNGEASEWVTPVVADYNNPGVLYIGNENVVKSTDWGQSWNPLGSIYTNSTTQQNTEISALAVANTNSNVIYAARRVRYELGLNGIVFRSTNGGVSFTNITNNLPDTLYYTGIEASNTNANEAVVCMAGFVNGCKVFKTTNGGGSWTNISYNLPNLPVNCIKYVPGSGQLMVATDIGIYVLNPSSTNWINYSLGLPNVIVSDIEFNSALNKIYVSTFGRGIWESNLTSVVGLKDKETYVQNIHFSVYPSINQGKFTVQVDDNNHHATIQILDVMGKMIYTGTLKDKENTIQVQATSGSYYVKITQQDKMGVKKIIIN